MSLLDTTHECPSPGCEQRVQFERLACPKHWYAISAPTRALIWREYQNSFGETSYFEARAQGLAEMGIPPNEIPELNGGVGLRAS